VVVGPSMENFRQIAGDFDRAGAWERAADAGELARVWRRWLDDPAAARAVGARAAALVDANRGALEKTLDLLREAMPEALGVARRDGGGAGGPVTDGGGDRDRGGADPGDAAAPGAAHRAGSASATAPAARAASVRP